MFKQQKTPKETRPVKIETIKEAAIRAVKYYKYCEPEELAIVWYFDQFSNIPSTLPRIGTKVFLYSRPRSLKGVIIASNSVDDIVWENDWKNDPMVRCNNKWISEKKLLTSLEA